MSEVQPGVPTSSDRPADPSTDPGERLTGWLVSRSGRLTVGVAAAVVAVGAVIAAVVRAPDGDVDAAEVERCATEIAVALGLPPVVVVERGTYVRPGGEVLEVWTASVASEGGLVRVHVADDGELVAAELMTTTGPEPLPPDRQQLIAGIRCR